MLLDRDTLERIVAGEVDLAFRRWARPTVKTGGSLRTAAGLLQIEKVELVSIDDITEQDARRAGLGRDDLVDFLRTNEGARCTECSSARSAPIRGRALLTHLR